LPTPTPTPQAGRLQFHWLSITRILWKSKISLLSLWLAVGLALAAIIHELPAIYKAECLLLVVEQKIPDKYVSATVNNTDPQVRLAAISHLILSNQHLQNIIDTFDLYKNERETMTKDQLINRMREKDISLTLESGLSNTRPDAFRISYEAKDPKLAADVANRLATLIIDENSRTRESQAEDTSQFIGAELQRSKQSLDALESRVSQWKLTHQGELPEQENALSAAFASLQVKLQGNQEGLNRADQSRALLANSLSLAQSSFSTLERSAEEAKEQAKRRPQTTPVVDPITSLPAPAPVKTRRQILKEELAQLSLRYGEEHPEIRRRKAELAELPPDREEPPVPAKTPASGTSTSAPAAAPSEPAVPSTITTAILAERERVSNLRVQLDLANKEFESAKAERVRILRDLEGTQARIDRLPLREQEMASLTRDYEMAKENYKSLLDRKLSASMATDLERSQQGERFTLIDKARVPDQPAKPPRKILYAVDGLLSLIISALVILARRLPKDTMLGEWELTPGVVVLGRVPRIETAKLGLAGASGGAHR
jgi:succinoglycan biosynthesis transport protein ExoP